MKLIALYTGFLYFPEDKSLYIPAVIEMILLLLLCIAVFMWFRKISNKQAMKAKEIEERILGDRKQNTEDPMKE